MANGGNLTATWGAAGRYGEFEIVGAAEAKPKLLGAGSFGKIFEAYRADPAAGGVTTKRFALKVLNPSLLTSETKRRQIRQELESLSEFDHPNLIRYVRSGEQEGEVYYAMDLCRGGDLSHLVRRFGPLPERVAALIGLQAAKGLRAVHERYRLLHRDLKPSNIMLAEELDPSVTIEQLALQLEEHDNLCRIVDFGLVTFQEESQAGRQPFVGSPMYASPEQIREQPLDGRSDLYSLGMTLWYLCQGNGPLLNARGDNLSTAESMERHLQDGEYAENIPSHLSPSFRAVLARLVAKAPDARFESANELQQVLRQYLSAQTDRTAFPLSRLPTALATAYELGQPLRASAAGSTYDARHRRTGERVRLTLVAESNASRPPAQIETMAAALCDLARLTFDPARPKTILPVREVIRASDILCYTEPLEPHISLANYLRARTQAHRGVTFVEGVSIFGPIATALDYLLQQGRETVFLTCDDIFLTGKGLVAGGPEPLALTPLHERHDLQVYFSMICLARADEQESDVDPMVSGSMDSSADPDQLHPVAAFARLIYRVLNGSEVPTSIKYAKNVYAPATTLENLSNNLIRDLLCRERTWTWPGAVLHELCRYEEVRWRPSKRDAGASASAAASADGGTSGGSVATVEAAVEVAAAVRAEVWSPDDTVVPPRTGSPPPLPQAPQPPQPPQPPLQPQGKVSPGQPGFILSPHGSRRLQRVAGADWAPGRRVICQETGSWFVLPESIPAMTGTVRYGWPGVAISPYGGGEIALTSPQQWTPRGPVRCTTGRIFLLPDQLEQWVRPTKKSKAPYFIAPAAVAGLLVLVGGALALLHPWKKSGEPRVTPSTPGPTAVVSTPPAKVRATPFPAGLANVPGSLVVGKWGGAAPPSRVTVLYHDRRANATLEPAGAGGFRVRFMLPEEARNEESPSVQLSIPGWAPEICALQPVGDGTFAGVSDGELQRARVPVEIATPETDYDFIDVEWLGPIAGEETFAPREPVIHIPTNNSAAASLATGRYRFTLTGRNPGRINPYPIRKPVDVTADKSPLSLSLPPSLTAGGQMAWWGFMTAEPPYTRGIFISVALGKKLSGAELRQFEIDRQPAFHFGDGKPLIGELHSNPTGLRLVNPGEAVFFCPVSACESRLTLKFDGSNRVLLVEPLVPPNADGVEQMRQRVLAEFQRQAQQALTGGSEFAPGEITKLRSSGLKELRLYAILSNPALYRQLIATVQRNAASLRSYGEDFTRGSVIPLISTSRDLVVRARSAVAWEAIPAPEN